MKMDYTPTLSARAAFAPPRKAAPAAKPAPAPSGKYVVQTMMMFVFMQMADDTVVELFNCPLVKGGYKWEKAKIREAFNNLHKRRRRVLTEAELEGFDDLVCHIADQCTPNLDLIKTEARSEFAQKLPYGQIEAATLLGVAYGCIKAAQRLNNHIAGRNISLLTQAMEALGEICDRVGFRPLNKGVWIDEDYCAEAWKKIIDKTASECVKNLQK